MQKFLNLKNKDETKEVNECFNEFLLAYEGKPTIESENIPVKKEFVN